MAEFIGSDHAIALQRRLRDTHAEIAANPALSNGGRVLNVLDIQALGWDALAGYAVRDGIVGLTAVPGEPTLRDLRARFDDDTALLVWRVFFGAPAPVTRACARLIADQPLPAGWRLENLTCPDPDTIDAVQTLNGRTGVAPTPAYYLRGEPFASMTTCLWDDEGALAACANGTMRYHPEGRLGGGFFAGAVSVDSRHRGKGLGSRTNAALLRDSQATFGWNRVLEQARADNAPSCRMIAACGLDMHPDLITIAISLVGQEFTR